MQGYNKYEKKRNISPPKKCSNFPQTADKFQEITEMSEGDFIVLFLTKLNDLQEKTTSGDEKNIP